MAQRIYIMVVGFSDEERHALNTVFRLSEQCRTAYQLWTPEAAEPARAALLDGERQEARLLAGSPWSPAQHLLWVGAQPPPEAVHAFQRPLAWGEVIECLDALFASDDTLDLDLAEPQDSVISQKLALIVSPDREKRLYLRARLALARLTLADEAQTGAEALELARGRQYDVAFLDGGLADMDPWLLLRQLRQGRHPVARVALTKAGVSVAERLRARLAGADALLDHPPHPAELKSWLKQV